MIRLKRLQIQRYNNRHSLETIRTRKIYTLNNLTLKASAGSARNKEAEIKARKLALEADSPTERTKFRVASTWCFITFIFLVEIIAFQYKMREAEKKLRGEIYLRIGKGGNGGRKRKVRSGRDSASGRT